MTLPIFEYIVNADSIEFKLGDVNHTMPKPLQYVKLSNDLSRVYVFSENNDIVFDAQYLPINGFNTMQDLYDDLKQYAVRSSSGGGTSIKTINSDTSLDETNTTSIILIDNTTNSVRIYLPDPVNMFYDGMSSRISIKATTVDVTTNKIQIYPSSSESIDAQTHYDFSVPYEAIELVTDGVNWWIISDKK